MRYVLKWLGASGALWVIGSIEAMAHGGHKGGHGRGGFSAPEIDASAGAATLAVLATMGVIAYARRNRK